MSRRKPRNLSADEKKLWSRVAETTAPLQKPQQLFDQPAQPQNVAEDVPEKFRNSFSVGQNAPTYRSQHSLIAPIGDRINGSSVQMDKKSFAKLKRGKLSPDGRIDLHGMTLAQAHPALIRFLLSAHAEQKRLVLVITGKGKSGDEPGPIPMRTGVLKHQVPQWLQQHPLKPIILQVAQASGRHGGSGAYYVYLRRNR